MENKKIKCVTYDWYDHLFIRNSKEFIAFIENTIKNHDYTTFLILQDFFNHRYQDKEDGNYLIFLPDYVQVEYEDESIENIPMTVEWFNQIQDSQWECG